MTQLLTPRVHTRQALNLRTQLHRQRIIPPRTRGEFRLTAFRRQRTARGGIQRNGDFGLREERTVSVLRRQMYQQPHKRCRSQSTSATCNNGLAKQSLHCDLGDAPTRRSRLSQA